MGSCTSKNSAFHICYRCCCRCCCCCCRVSNDETTDETTLTLAGDELKKPDDVERNNVTPSSPRRPPRISVTLTTTTHLELLKSLGELQEEEFDVLTPNDMSKKEETNAVFIQGLENPIKYNVGS